MIGAGKLAHILAAHWLGYIAAQQHDSDQTDLVDVVALLPAPLFAPGDFVRHVKDVERVRGDSTRIDLMGRDAEVSELELLAIADEDVERSKISVQCLSAMQSVKRGKDSSELTPYESLGLRSAPLEPGAQVTVLRVLDRKAISQAAIVRFGKAVVDAKRPLVGPE